MVEAPEPASEAAPGRMEIVLGDDVRVIVDATVHAPALARVLEPTIGPRERAIVKTASSGFGAHRREIAAARRVEPRDDILSALVLAEDDGDRLSERETLDMLRLLLIAGNETTTNLTG